MLSAGIDEYPVDHELFDALGAAARKLATDLPNSATGQRYAFLRNDVFHKISDDRRKMQIYWQEMFLRAHWAAMLNLRRHERWQSACIMAYEATNFYSFVASLRGLLEAALDAHYSLGPVPISFAEHYEHIQSALHGELNGALISSEIEDRLIHFVYARKLEKREQGIAPDSHEALDPREYRNALHLPGQYRDGFRRLYDELCAYCHPTAFSLRPLWRTLPDGKITFVVLDDQQAIKQLVDTHREAIEFALGLSVTTSVLVLRTINQFTFSEVHCTAVEQWNLSNIKAWETIAQKIENARQDVQ